MSALARRIPAWAITAALGVVYLIIAPSSPDLAAASYRSDLFAQAGFSLWDNSWYGGHHLLAYSVLAPPLGALLGPRVLVALSMTAAAALFALLIDGVFPSRATRVAAIWLAVGAGHPDALLARGLRPRARDRPGVPAGGAQGPPLGGARAGGRCARWPARSRAPSSRSASSHGAWAAARGPGRRRSPPLRVIPVGLIELAFPEGGTQPFVASAFWPALVGVLIIGALVPAQQRTSGSAWPCTRSTLIAAYVLPTAFGANSDRLGAIFAGPLAACVLIDAPPERRNRLILLVLAPFLFYWQVNEPVADYRAASSDPGVNESYYGPLLGELHASASATAPAPPASRSSRWQPTGRLAGSRPT